MLTKKDLVLIDEIITRRIRTEVKPIVRAEVKPIVRAEVKPIKQDIAHIRKDIKTIVNFFDTEYLELRKRVERIEEHLHFPLIS